MRLTLRTLLAWRDGLLSAEDTREIGARVDASLTARLMAGRIDAVTAGDRVPSGESGLWHGRGSAAALPPHATGGGRSQAGPDSWARLDEADLSTCNSIAEYIANRLPADRMPTFEKECLQSESLLREVAGCHRLIADIERDSGLLMPADPLEVARIQAAVQALAHRQTRAGRLPDGQAGGSEGRPDARDGHSASAGEGEGVAASPAAEAEPVIGWRESVADPTVAGPEGGAARAWSAAVAAMLLVAALLMALVLVVWNANPTSPVQPTSPLEKVARLEPGHAEAETAALPDAPGVADPQASTLEEQPAVAENPAAPPFVATRDGGIRDGGGEAPLTPPEAEGSMPGEGRTPVAVDPVAAPRDGGDGQPGMPRQEAVPGGDAMAIAAAPRSGPDGSAGPDRGEVAVGEPGGAVVQPGGEPVTPPPRGTDGERLPIPREAAVGAFSEDPLVLVRRAVEPAGDSVGPASLDPASETPPADDSAASADWRPARSMESIKAGDELLVPGGFLPAITVGGCGLRLFPMTRIRIDASSEDSTPSVELIEGRAVVLSTGDGEGLQVRLGGLAGFVKAAPGAVIGMEVVRRLPDGIDPLVASVEGRMEAVIVESASLRFPAGGRWRSRGAVVPDLGGIGEDGEIAPGKGLSWSSLEPSEAVVGPLEPGRDWVEAPAPIDRIERMAAAEIVARTAAVSPVQRALRELSVDTRVENRLAAAEALAAMGRFEVMVELLCADGAADDLSATQWRSLVERAVVPALARGPGQVESLLAALEDHAPHGEAGRLYAYAVGFSDEELEQGAAEDLVAALDHPELVVRRFAAWRLEQIVRPKANERIRYRAERSTTLRADGVRWWRQQLEKGLIRRSPPGGLSRG